MGVNENAPGMSSVRESCYCVIFNADSSEILMVLNPSSTFTKHGVAGLVETVNKTKGYGCPGGGAKEGEGFREAAIRESREEASIEVVLNESSPWVSTPVRDNHRKTYFLADSFEGMPRPNPDFAKEIIAVEWVPVENFFTKEDWEEVLYKGDPIYRGHMRMIRELLRYAGIMET